MRVDFTGHIEFDLAEEVKAWGDNVTAVADDIHYAVERALDDWGTLTYNELILSVTPDPNQMVEGNTDGTSVSES